MHNAALLEMGIDARYEAWSIGAEELPAVMHRLRSDEMLGLNVTINHKERVVTFVDALDADAQAIGAVNCISKADGRLTGHNTDKYGFLRSLREGGFEPSGRKAVILGYGGSARAVVRGLLDAGVVSVIIAGRRGEPAGELAAVAQRQTPGARIRGIDWEAEAFRAAVGEADLVVNCTPVGMSGRPEVNDSPLGPDLIRPGLCVFDLVYNPLETRLLAEARAAGALALGGFDMLVYQAAESLRIWTGREAPVDIMKSAALRALGFTE
jgi:shikimate dehydrogenase